MTGTCFVMEYVSPCGSGIAAPVSLRFVGSGIAAPVSLRCCCCDCAACMHSQDVLWLHINMSERGSALIFNLANPI